MQKEAPNRDDGSGRSSQDNSAVATRGSYAKVLVSLEKDETCVINYGHSMSLPQGTATLRCDHTCPGSAKSVYIQHTCHCFAGKMSDVWRVHLIPLAKHAPTHIAHAGRVRAREFASAHQQCSPWRNEALPLAAVIMAGQMLMHMSMWAWACAEWDHSPAVCVLAQ
eukprot:1146070-Pelagomonas_calceolata.AAC.9